LRERFPRSLAHDHLRWLDLSSGILTPDAAEHAERQRRTARALLQRLFGRDSVPGVILGDEVGMGKTYEALAVIAALFRHKRSARILVLTHSHAMAETWNGRWDGLRKDAVVSKYRDDLHEGELLYDIRDLGRGCLGFASYDKLKLMPTHELHCALERCFQSRYLRAKTRRRLVRELFGRKVDPIDGVLADKIPHGALDRFWRDHFDTDERSFLHPWSARRELRRLVYRAARTKRLVDLLVVDEAHKVASDQRNMFFEDVLGSRARRALYVTATPFSLSIEQLYERIADIHVVTGAPIDGLPTLWKEMELFRQIVQSRDELPTPLRRGLQERLRRYLVRSLWPEEITEGTPRRKAVTLTTDPVKDEQNAHVMLALETALVGLDGTGARTHSTAHRETLCSSYEAIRDAADRSRTNGAAFASRLTSLAAIIPARGELPKFEAVAAYLLKVARRREKAVVFCSRRATVTALRDALHKQLRDEMDVERKRWTRVRNRLRGAEKNGLAVVDRGEWPKLRLAVHAFRDVAVGREAAALKRLKRVLEKSGEPGEDQSRAGFWDQSWGRCRRVDWVGVLAGQHEEDEGRRSSEAVQFAFNLPGPPYVLICTKMAREGIDLHLWCRRVVQYDLEWNPALMEQQIGRVDRIGSLSRRDSQPVEVVWAWVPGTFEEYMARKVKERMEMMKILLGAGEWLASSPDEQQAIVDLDAYRLDFAP
jgi:hypothetical protein